MADDSTAGLGTMLAFLSQNQNQGPQGIPQMPNVPNMQVNLPEMNTPQGYQGGGLFKGILGNLASSYISNKFSKYQDKQEAEELAVAYSPVVKAQTESEENPILKKQYGVFQSMIDSKHPALVAKGLAGVMEIQKAQETAALREEPNLIREVADMYPYLKLGTPEFAQKAAELKKMSSMSINMGNELPPPPQGYMWNREGNAQVAIPGGPADQTTKPLTEFEGKASSYSKRMNEAHQTLLDNENILDVPQLSSKQWAEHLPVVGPALGAFMNTQLKANQQRVDRAQRGFVNALLRHDSGATINPDEFDNYKKEYFPATGDSPEAIADKRAAREAAIANMDIEAGAGGQNWKTKVRDEGGIIPATKSSKEKMIPSTKVATGVKLPKGQNIGDTFDMPDGIKTIFRGNINGQPKYEPLNNESFINGKPRLSQEEAYRMAKERGLIK